MKSVAARALVCALSILSIAVPAAFAQVGPDYVTSDNVEYVGPIKTVGDGVGATIIKDMNRMFVTSTQGLHIFDITDAEKPVELGIMAVNVEFENEEVPTNGKLLGISSDLYCVVPSTPPTVGSAATGGCLSIYDVSNPTAVKLLTVVPGAGDHTSACILDCSYMYGDSGTITDLRDPAKAKIVGNWTEGLAEGGKGCHHVREVSPGIILGSCQPITLLSVLPEHGGSPLKPAQIALGINEDNRFIHSSRWPRGGRDKIMLAGGEQNFQPQCDDQVSAFMTWDATKVINPFGGWNVGSQFQIKDEIKPVNGTYVDGNAPYNALGCSVHWFMEHPTFKNGGLVALAEYEQGTRFLQIGNDGKITEQGYFQPLGGSTSAPHWHPAGKVVYAIDYTRGIDILRWKGENYVPDGVPDPTAVPGTGGAQPNAPACASAAGFKTTGVKPVGRGLEFQAERREESSYTVDVFQQSAGRKVVRERLVARFLNQTGPSVWNGNDRKNRKLADGFYFVRYTMKLAAGGKDVRRVTVRRRGGKFAEAPDFYQRTDCGLFKAFKLSSSAFGGTRNVPLGIAYRIAQNVESIKIEAIVGKKVVKTFKAKAEKDRGYRFSLPAKLVRRGKQVQIRATVVQGSRTQVQTLVATRV